MLSPKNELKCLTYIQRQREDKQAYQFEKKALLTCACDSVQALLGFDDQKQVLQLRWYVESQDLLQLQVEQAALFLQLVPRIIRAIHFCHQNGWVHGDIKPSNVLYTPSTGAIILIDFAAALPIGMPMEELTRWEMTPSFASAEKCKGEGRVSAKDDWYALLMWLKQLENSQQIRLTRRERLRLSRYIHHLSLLTTN